MAIQITMCPACQSSFHLNASGLTSIDGRVRCGACLTVFKAKDHLIEAGANYQNSIEGSVFMSEEPLDYFSPLDFLNIETLHVNNEVSDGKSGKKE